MVYDTFQKWGTTGLNMGLTFLADRDKATLSVSHRSKAFFLTFLNLTINGQKRKDNCKET